jgi:hypothetical protein
MTTLITFRNKVFTRLLLLSFQEKSSNHCNRSADYHGANTKACLSAEAEKGEERSNQETRDQTSSQFYFHPEKNKNCIIQVEEL